MLLDMQAALIFIALTSHGCCDDRSVSFIQQESLGGSGDSAVHAVAVDVPECALLCALHRHCQAFQIDEADKRGCELCTSRSRCGAGSGDRVMLDAASTSAGGSIGAQVSRGNRTFQVIQQRVSGAVNFARNWTEYENGFGDEENFWIGLKRIHALTQPDGTTFRAELQLWNGTEFVIEYSGFSVVNTSLLYRMTYTSYLMGSSNTSQNGLSSNNNVAFSTKDMDNDQVSGLSCSVLHGNGGWWFNNCGSSFPNGGYPIGSADTGKAVASWPVGNGPQPIKEMRMLLQI